MPATALSPAMTLITASQTGIARVPHCHDGHRVGSVPDRRNRARRRTEPCDFPSSLFPAVPRDLVIRTVAHCSSAAKVAHEDLSCPPPTLLCDHPARCKVLCPFLAQFVATSKFCSRSVDWIFPTRQCGDESRKTSPSTSLPTSWSHLDAWPTDCGPEVLALARPGPGPARPNCARPNLVCVAAPTGEERADAAVHLVGARPVSWLSTCQLFRSNYVQLTARMTARQKRRPVLSYRVPAALGVSRDDWKSGRLRVFRRVSAVTAERHMRDSVRTVSGTMLN